jgi:hypothetical protein
LENIDLEPDVQLIQNIIAEATGAVPSTVGSRTRSEPTFTGADSVDATTTTESGTTAAAASLATPATEQSPDSVTRARNALSLKKMVAPEIWANLMPAPLADTAPVSSKEDSKMPADIAKLLPPPPTGDTSPVPVQPAPVVTESLKIIVAICGIADVTDTIQAMVKDNEVGSNHPFPKQASC